MAAEDQQRQPSGGPEQPSGAGSLDAVVGELERSIDACDAELRRIETLVRQLRRGGRMAGPHIDLTKEEAATHAGGGGLRGWLEHLHHRQRA